MRGEQEMLSSKGLSDFKCLLGYISDFKDSVFEIRSISNTSGEEYVGGGQYKYQKDIFEIIFIFRELYNTLPSYATTKLEYMDGGFGFTHEKIRFDATELQQALNSNSMDTEAMNDRFYLLYKTVMDEAERIVSAFNSVHF